MNKDIMKCGHIGEYISSPSVRYCVECPTIEYGAAYVDDNGQIMYKWEPLPKYNNAAPIASNAEYIQGVTDGYKDGFARGYVRAMELMMEDKALPKGGKKGQALLWDNELGVYVWADATEQDEAIEEAPVQDIADPPYYPTMTSSPVRKVGQVGCWSWETHEIEWRVMTPEEQAIVKASQRDWWEK